MEVQPVEIYKFKKVDSVNNKCLNNSIENLAYVYKLDHHQDPTDKDFQLDFYEISQAIRSLHDSKGYGWALTNIPDLLVESNGTISRHILDINNQ